MKAFASISNARLFLANVAADRDIAVTDLVGHQIGSLHGLTQSGNSAWSVSLGYTTPEARGFISFPDGSGTTTQDFDNVVEALDFIGRYYA